MSNRLRGATSATGRCAVKLERGEALERGTIAALVALGGLVGGEGEESSYSLRSRNLINLIAKDKDYMVLRNRLPPLLRRNGLATKNSLCSLRLPPYIYSPVRFIPAIGVMSGAHYRTLLMFFTSPTRSRSSWGPRIAILVR